MDYSYSSPLLSSGCLDPSLWSATASIDPTLLVKLPSSDPPNPADPSLSSYRPLQFNRLLDDIHSFLPPSPDIPPLPDDISTTTLNHSRPLSPCPPPQQTTLASLRLSPHSLSHHQGPTIKHPHTDISKSPTAQQEHPSSSKCQASNSLPQKLEQDLPPFPQLGQRFKNLEHFRYESYKAAWAHGHGIKTRSCAHAANRTTQIFSCTRDRAPPKGVSCGFRISVNYSDVGSHCTVTSLVLQHTGHNPKPGDHNPNSAQRHWLESLALGPAVSTLDLQLESHVPGPQDSESQSKQRDAVFESLALKAENEAPDSTEWVKLNTSRVEPGNGRLWVQHKAVKRKNLGDDLKKAQEDEITVVNGSEVMDQEARFNSKRKKNKQVTSPSPAAFDEGLQEATPRQKCRTKTGIFLGVFLPSPPAANGEAKAKRSRDLKREWSQEGQDYSRLVSESCDFSRKTSPCALDGNDEVDNAYILPIEPRRGKRGGQAVEVRRPGRQKELHGEPSIDLERKSRPKKPIDASRSGAAEKLESKRTGKVGATPPPIHEDLLKVQLPKDLPLENGLVADILLNALAEIGQPNQLDTGALLADEQVCRARVEALMSDFLSQDADQAPELEPEPETLESLLKACHYKLPSLSPQLRSAGLTTARSLLKLNRETLFDILKPQEAWMASLLWRRLKGRLKCESTTPSRNPDSRCWCWPRPNGPGEEGICNRCLFWKVQISRHGFVQDESL